jgi:hypothetical protein
MREGRGLKRKLEVKEKMKDCSNPIHFIVLIYARKRGKELRIMTSCYHLFVFFFFVVDEIML